jgi:hypothetical protein
MCIEDWRLGRQIRSQLTSKALTVGQTLSVPISMQRVAITLASDPSSAVFNEQCSVTIGGLFFCVLQVSQSLIHMTLLEHGDLVTKQFTVTCGANPRSIVIVEYFLPESVLSDPLESQQRPY